MNGTHQVLDFADKVNLMVDIWSIEWSSDVLNVCKDIGLVVNSGKTKYIEVGDHWNMMADEHITVGSNSYERKPLNI